MDIETISSEGVMTPYCISISDGNTAWSYYLSDYNDSNLMIKHALSFLLIRKYKNHKVYVHNLSSFDSVFLLRILNNMENVNTRLIQNNGKLINLNINYDNKYTLSLRDSLLLLPSPLAKLSKSFNTNTQYKDILPIIFLNNVEHNYVGSVPDFKYFKGINLEEYLNYKESFNSWSLKEF